jgi:DNA polymerase III delta subunit
MYYSATQYLKVLGDSKSIPKKRIFLFLGEDPFVKEECFRMLCKKMKILPRSQDSTGIRDRDLIRILLNPGFFDPEQSHLFRIDKDKSLDDRKEFLRTLPSVSNGSIFSIFIVRDSAHTDSALFNIVKEYGVVVNCKELREFDEDIRFAVKSMFSSNGHIVSDEVCIRILDLIGASMSRIANAVKLLTVYGEPITIPVVEKVLSPFRDDNFMEIFMLIAFRNLDKVLLLTELMVVKDPSVVIPLLDQLLVFLSRMLFTLKTPESQRTEIELSVTLGVKPFLTKKYIFLCKFYDEDRVRHCYKLALQTYVDCFTIKDKGLLLTRVLLELCK